MSNPSTLLRDIAQIARITDGHQTSFYRLVRWHIKTAGQESRRKPKKNNTSAQALRRDYFGPVIQAANALKLSLRKIAGSELSINSPSDSTAANIFFGMALQRRYRTRSSVDDIGELIDDLNLDRLIEIADSAGELAKTHMSKAGFSSG